MLRHRRLTYLARLLRHGPRFLLPLIALAKPSPGSWAQLIVEDLECLRRTDCSFAGLPEPTSCLPVWLQFVLEDGTRWSLRLESHFRGSLAAERAKLFATAAAPLAEFVAARAASAAAAGEGTPQGEFDEELTVAELAAKYPLGCPGRSATGGSPR